MKNEKRQRQAIGGRDYSAEQGSGKSKNRSAKKGFFAGFSLGILAFVAAGCLLTLALWLNLGGLKEQVVGFFNLEEIEQAKIAEEKNKIEEQQAQISQREAVLQEQEAAADKLRTSLDKQQETIELRCQELAAEEERLNGRLADINDLVQLYEVLEPNVAAGILESYGNKAELTAILIQLDSARLSQILSCLKPQDASKLMELLINAT